MYFYVNFNVFFKLIKVHLLVSELYVYQKARFNNKKKINVKIFRKRFFFFFVHVPAIDDEVMERET